MMLNKRNLVGIMIWPATAHAAISLYASTETITDDGEVLEAIPVATFPLKEPMRGDVLSRLVPDYAVVGLVDCAILDETDRNEYNTKQAFDTAVVTERVQTSLEDRLLMLERKQVRAQRRADREHEELVMLRKREKLRQGPELIEDEPAPAKEETSTPDAPEIGPEAKEGGEE